MKKKCLNCLCMVDIEVKVCTFCKTPFKEGRHAPLPRKAFTPPQVVIKDFQIPADNNIGEEENLETPDLQNTQDDNLEINLDTLGFIEEELDFKELKKRVPKSAIVYEIKADRSPQGNSPVVPGTPGFNIGNTNTNKPLEPEIPSGQIKEEPNQVQPPVSFIIKDRVKRYSEKLVIEEPFSRIPFEIDSLEVSEIKDAPEIERQGEVKAETVEVDPEKLKDLNDLARIMSPQQDEINDVGEGLRSSPTEADEQHRFDSKNVVRVSNTEIIEQSAPEPPSKNIRNAIEALKSVQEVTSGEITSEAVSDFSANETDAFTVVSDNNLNKFSGQKSTNISKAIEHYNKAKNFCVKGNYQKALEELETAVKLDPAFEQAHILLSRTYLKLKNN